MGLITKKLKVMGDKGEREVNCLFDSGASVSFIREDIQRAIATPFSLLKLMSFQLGDGRGRIEADRGVFLRIVLPEGDIFDDVVIVDSLGEEMVIGAQTLQRWRIKLDFEHDDIIVDKKALELKLI
ncbi:MAG: retropepsin-like aspartic protease [bacterium]